MRDTKCKEGAEAIKECKERRKIWIEKEKERRN
jgi:hypothetical protein